MTTIAHHADYLCSAVSRIGSESAFAVLARAKAIEATGRRVVHMEIGEPDFDTPEHIKEAGIQAIRDNYSHYTPSAGIPELRDTIAAYASSFRGLAEPFTRENVVVGAGAKPIIWNLLSALLDPGDELIYADPAYPAYASAAGYLEAKAIPVHLLESRDWRLDLDELAAKITPKTKAVVINSPHNPTGGVLTREDLETIAELSMRHGFLVISDEIYSRNTYGPKFESITQVDGMRDRTIVVDGFSKAYAMTGWRLGYCIAPKGIAETVTLFNNNTFSCVATFVQRAGIAALTGDDTPVQRMNATFRERRDAIVSGLNAIPNVSCTLPEGAFYAFPNVSKITSDDKHLATWLLDNAGVACLGGSSFGAAGTGYLRFSYAASLDDIAWALAQLREALPKYTPA
ncbi:MAG TPA: pyridoxal phosphate-dependent aminotransferase [Candidatus Elarobacter sp.]|jgi:aspartate/methionine/tyrosine aminotransferase|nr:pyridoxal phosphate-dependent aminotransferase [Candidatus Elarobacter sp.]